MLHVMMVAVIALQQNYELASLVEGKAVGV